MSFSGTTYGDIGARVGIYAVAKFLAHAVPTLILEKFAMVQAVPKNTGQVIKWRRAIPYTQAVDQLVEGVTPAPQGLQFEDVSSVVSQYGAWIPYTDVIEDTHEDPVLATMTQLAGEQAALTKERILWNMMVGGVNVIYSGTATARNQVVAPIGQGELNLAQRTLKNALATTITKMLDASPKIATQPVAAAYIAIGHTNMEQDLRVVPGFVPVENYSTTAQLVSPLELGKYQSLRFVLAPHLTYFAGAGGSSATVLNTGGKADVYPLVIFGADAFAATPLKGMDSARIAVKNPKMGVGDTDPLGQRGYVAWKFWYSAARLNEAWIVRIESAVSAT